MAHNYTPRTIVRGTLLKSMGWDGQEQSWEVVRRVKTPTANNIYIAVNGKHVRVPANAFHFMLKTDLLRIAQRGGVKAGREVKR